jgi:hypothetical protein
MSTPITITVPHKLGAVEARQRIDDGFGQIERQFGGNLANVEKRWSGDRLDFSARVLGQELKGWMLVAASEVRMEVLLPGILGVIAGKIRGGLQKQGQILLEDKRK